MQAERNLLDTLHGLVGCEYISDLKSDAQRDRVLQAINEIDRSSFPPADWEKVISYLFNTDVPFHSLEDVQAFITREEHL